MHLHLRKVWKKSVLAFREGLLAQDHQSKVDHQATQGRARPPAPVIAKPNLQPTVKPNPQPTSPVASPPAAPRIQVPSEEEVEDGGYSTGDESTEGEGGGSGAFSSDGEAESMFISGPA